MMIKNLYYFTFFLTLLLFSCVNEPTIEPTPTPYTSVRLGNFADNVGTITVSIQIESKDKNVPNEVVTQKTIQKGDLTEYFDLISGKRIIVVTDENGAEIFKGQQNFTSYDEANLLFSGYSAPGDDINNTFGPFYFSDGVVYLREEPQLDTLVWVHYFNLISDTPEALSPAITVESIDSVNNENVATNAAFKFNTVKGVNVSPGEKTFSVKVGEDEISNYSAAITSGKRYYLFIVGPVGNPVFYLNSQAPLPIRNKW